MALPHQRKTDPITDSRSPNLISPLPEIAIHFPAEEPTGRLWNTRLIDHRYRHIEQHIKITCSQYTVLVIDSFVSYKFLYFICQLAFTDFVREANWVFPVNRKLHGDLPAISD